MVPKYVSNNSIRDVVHSTEILADFCLNNLTYLIISTRKEVLFNHKTTSWSVVLVSTESNFCVGDYSKCVLMQWIVELNHSKLIGFIAVFLFMKVFSLHFIQLACFKDIFVNSYCVITLKLLNLTALCWFVAKWLKWVWSFLLKKKRKVKEKKKIFFVGSK